LGTTIWQNLYKTFSPGEPKLNFCTGYIIFEAGEEDPSAKKPQDDLKWEVILNPGGFAKG
jgi:hypothetical protein